MGKINNSNIDTQINRKGEYSSRKKEKYIIIFPKLQKKKIQMNRLETFCMKMYKGNAEKLVASLFEQDIIRPEDIEQLKRFWKEGEESMLNNLAKSIFFLSLSGSFMVFAIFLVKAMLYHKLGKKWFYYIYGS
jgi:hypothetical protein